ncbi:MAG: PHP domain-containing protein [Candidatus Thorarchaeota archaeon]
MLERADLHVHSWRSDGKYSPSDIVRLAASVGLGAVALTDHENVTGIEEFLNMPAPTLLQRVPGVEISSDYGTEEIHILGYFIDYSSESLSRGLEDLLLRKEQRFREMVDRLRGLGIEIDDQDIRGVLSETRAPGRPHLARLLVKKGVVSDAKRAFELYLGENKPAYVERRRASYSEAIRLVARAGGVPVLAHPLKNEIDDLEKMIRDLKREGLEGTEVFYSYSDPKKIATEELENLAKELDLVMTGGSDFHGDADGPPLGGVTVSIDVVSQLRERARSQH